MGKLMPGNKDGKPSTCDASKWVPLAVMIGWIAFTVVKGWRHDAQLTELRRDVEEIKAKQDQWERREHRR